MLQIDVDEVDLGCLEGADFGLGGGWLAVDAEADEAAVDGAAREPEGLRDRSAESWSSLAAAYFAGLRS